MTTRCNACNDYNPNSIKTPVPHECKYVIAHEYTAIYSIQLIYSLPMVLLINTQSGILRLWRRNLFAVVHVVLTCSILDAVATPTPFLDIASANRGSNTGGSEEIASSGATNTPECAPLHLLSKALKLKVLFSCTGP